MKTTQIDPTHLHVYVDMDEVLSFETGARTIRKRHGDE